MILFWACINSIKKLNQQWRKHEPVSYAQQEDGLQETVGAFALYPPYFWRSRDQPVTQANSTCG
jgi:hypothetical protein